MQGYLDSFTRAAARARPALEAARLETHVGRWHDSAVLKLQKHRWTGAVPSAGPGETGLFFSVWMDEPSIARERVRYNIHALKLGALDAYSIRSREFAAAFRSAFEPLSAGWPNITTDHGPQTLMQGWIKLEFDRLESDVGDLVRRFIPLAPLLDTLLDQRPNPARVARSKQTAPWPSSPPGKFTRSPPRPSRR